MSTMTASDLRSYVESAEQNKDSWLGIVLVWSVMDSKVSWAELDRKMRENGLAAYVPPEPKDENVFRRVFSDGVRRTIDAPTADEPQAERRLLMRLVAREQGKHTKRIVIEHVGPAGKTLGYEEAIEVVFDKERPERLYIRDLLSPRDDDAWELVQHLRSEYDRERGCVDGQAVRTLIRAVLDDCRSTSLRPGGGCYFLPQYAVPRADALAAVADNLPGTLVHTLPLIDNENQRRNLRKAFEFEAQTDLESLIAEMRELSRSGEELSPQRVAAFAKQAKKAKAKLGEYQSLLDDNLGVVDAKLSIMEQLQLQLLQQVKS